PSRPWSTDSRRNDARPVSRSRRYAASGVRRSMSMAVVVISSMQNDPRGSSGGAVRAVGAFCSAHRLPPRSWRQAHQLRVGKVISRQPRRAWFNAQAMAAPELLTALLSAPGPSGHEEEPARIWRDAASQFAEVWSDTMGSSFARVRAGDGAPTLALVG